MGWWQRALAIAVGSWALLILAGCGGSDLPDEPDAPHAITRKVLLVNAPLERARAIEVLRDAAGLSEEQAGALLDGMPGVVASGLSHGAADAIVRKLSEAGMTTQIRRD